MARRVRWHRGLVGESHTRPAETGELAITTTCLCSGQCLELTDAGTGMPEGTLSLRQNR